MDSTVRTLSRAAPSSLRAELSFHPAMIFTTNSSDRMARIRPKPAYSFFPMVIARFLRSPRQSHLGLAASAGTTLPQAFPLAGVKLKFNNLRGLLRRRHKLPLLDGVLTGLNEQGMSADDARALDTTVRGDDDFNFDFASNVHALCKVGIDRGRFGPDLALRFVRGTRLGETRNPRKNECSGCRKNEFLPPTDSHGHHSSWERKKPREREGTWDAMPELRGNSLIAARWMLVSGRRAVG